jgi:hypothetical protein
MTEAEQERLSAAVYEFEVGEDRSPLEDLSPAAVVSLY